MSLTVTDNEIYAGLIGFIQLVVPQGTPIIRGQQNRVPMPNTDFVLLTTLGAPLPIGTNYDDVTPVTDARGNIVAFAASVTTDYQYRVQADFYSQYAESWATAAAMLWRDNIGYEAMPDSMKPLFSEDLRQVPLIGAEDQWIQRWTLTLVLDYQPTWVQPTVAITAITVIPEPVDIYLPPDYTADSDTPSDSDRTM